VPDVEKGAEVRGAVAATRVKIVIPAHDEAAVVDRCLSAVLASARPGEFDVVVISNGSTDDTVQRARAAGARLNHDVEVIEIPTASKIAALQAADEMLIDFPDAIRLFLDADVILSTQAARTLVEALDTTEPRLAVAKLDVDTSLSSWPVRRYYRAWTALPYVENQVAGSGVFAMNGAGALRVGSWPDVINDDGYAARCFDADQRVLVDATFRAFAAHSFSALVRRRARIVNGNRQLDAILPQIAASAGTPGAQNGLGALVSAVRAGKVDWVSGLVFASVTVSARALAGWRRKTGATARWSTDLTTRQAST
jgi:glycosyltransferase involved in cell wall biosynthesis